MALNLKESRLLRISSKDRTLESPSKYQITFKTNDNDLHQIRRVVLKSAIIPNSQYNIHKNNNTFYFNQPLPVSDDAEGTSNDNSDDVTDGVVNENASIEIISGGIEQSSDEKDEAGVYTIPVGQYTITTLISTLQNTIPGLTITQSALTKKLTLAYTSSISVFVNNNPMARVLGISEDIENVSTYTCLSLPDLSGLENIYIASQCLSNHSAMICNDKKKQSVFCSVGINVPFGQTMILEEDSISLDYTDFYAPRNISTIDITLLDENNDVLDLNGLDWVLTFRVYK